MHQVWIPLDRIELNINARKIKASMQTQHYNLSRKRGLENLEKEKEYHFSDLDLFTRMQLLCI